MGGSVLNHALNITSICADIIADSVVGTSFIISDHGTFVRDPSTYVIILPQNEEEVVAGHFSGSDEAYDASAWFDLVICVPGTPFELARFKNLSYTQ